MFPIFDAGDPMCGLKILIVLKESWGGKDGKGRWVFEVRDVVFKEGDLHCTRTSTYNDEEATIWGREDLDDVEDKGENLTPPRRPDDLVNSLTQLPRHTPSPPSTPPQGPKQLDPPPAPQKRVRPPPPPPTRHSSHIPMLRLF
ncbi:hypothetical protein L218DRAFT_1000299 [Marasmius fiardii PR-910]|nr:hypothetical protein L218DRAFT_1000299 [Marasmius fiardii PR-910]